MGNRSHGFGALASGFSDGWDLTNRIMRDIGIANVSKETESQTYTPEQAQQLEALASAKDEQGNPYYTLGANEDGTYSVTPNFKGGEGQDLAASKIAAQGVNFLGKSYDQPLTDGQRQSARAQAMAGVMEKFGDAEGAMRYRQSAQQADMMQMQGDQMRRQAARDDRIDRQTAQQDELDADLANWTKQRLQQPDGSMRDMTPDDHLAAGQYRVAKLVGAGRVADANALAQANMALAGQKIQLETAERDKALGVLATQVAAGDLSGVNDFYAKYVPDGAHLDELQVDPKTGKITANRTSVDGRQLTPQTFKNRDELMAGLTALKDPQALYNFSQNEFTRSLHERQEKRADAQSAATIAHLNAQTELAKAQAGAATAKVDQGKPMPDAAAKGLLENQATLRRVVSALALVKGGTADGVQGDAAASGLKGMLPNGLLNRVDPKGVSTRAAVANLASSVIHDRSGAAVTAAEFPRLAPFVPTETDDQETQVKKLEEFARAYSDQVQDTINFYKASGHKVPADVLKQVEITLPVVQSVQPGADSRNPAAAQASFSHLWR